MVTNDTCRHYLGELGLIMSLVGRFTLLHGPQGQRTTYVVLPLSLQRCDTSRKLFDLCSSAHPAQETISAVTWTLLPGFATFAEECSVGSFFKFQFTLISSPPPSTKEHVNLPSKSRVALSSTGATPCCFPAASVAL